MQALFRGRHGAEQLMGLAPMGDLERLVQAELDATQD